MNKDHGLKIMMGAREVAWLLTVLLLQGNQIWLLVPVLGHSQLPVTPIQEMQKLLLASKDTHMPNTHIDTDTYSSIMIEMIFKSRIIFQCKKQRQTRL